MGDTTGAMHVTVLGAGTMGVGIANVCAAAGHHVTVRDIDANLVMDGIDTIETQFAGAVDRDLMSEEEKADAIDRIDGTTDLPSAVSGADMVIEAVPEEMDIKHDVFTDVEASADEDAIIATNTSSLSVTDIASVLDHPDRAIGLHFFNPAHVMEPVEIILGDETADQVRAETIAFVEDIGKTPIVVRDSPGFASSRLGLALGAEAIRMVEQGVAGVEDIDRAMELGYNHPMGPLELTDLVGLDVRLDILEYLHEELGDRFEPPQLLRELVEAGDLGKKSGQGFYEWEHGEVVGVAIDNPDAPSRSTAAADPADE